MSHSAFTPVSVRFTGFDPRGIIDFAEGVRAFLFCLQCAAIHGEPEPLSKVLANVDSGTLFGENMSRRTSYKKRWYELISYYGARCYYCRKEAATTIDHVVPYSWDAHNEIENLVPACVLCNAIAGDKVFEDVEQKRQYILKERSKRSNMRAICSECLLPFNYRSHSPSAFLCAECYDVEYDTKHSKTSEWHKWLYQLRRAGIPAEAHRAMKARMAKDHHKSRDAKLEVLIDEYSHVVDTDPEFAEMLMVA